MHESGQESVSMTEASELQRQSTERLEEHAESRTQGSIEMDQIKTSTVTTERFEEKLVIKQHLTDQRVEKGQHSQFKTIIENAQNVQWSINGQPIGSTTPGVKISSSPAYEHELLIESSQDSSTIKCEAQNSVSKVDTSAKLIVEPKGDPPQITQAPNSRTVSEHEVVQFSATVTSKLRPFTVEWSVDGQVVQPTSSEFGLTQSGDQFTLRVNDSAVHQTGQIKITATNPAGSVNATADFTVNKKAKPVPKFTSQLPNELRATEGEPFQVSVKAPNADNIEWTINGKPLQVNDL